MLVTVLVAAGCHEVPEVPDVAGDMPRASDGGAPDTTLDAGRGDTRTDAAEMGPVIDLGPDADPRRVACLELPVPQIRWDMTDTEGSVLNTGRSDGPTINLDGAPTADGLQGDALLMETFEYQPRVAHHPALEIEQGTLSVWVAPDEAALESGEAAVFSKDASGTDVDGHLELELRSGEFRARLQRSDREIALFYDYAHPAAEWHHLVVTWQPGAFEFFVDGESVGREEDGWSIATNDEPLGIGFSTSNSSTGSFQPSRGPWSGMIDEMTIWDEVLDERLIEGLSHPECVTPSAGGG